jgi:hypothetical protein
VDILKDGATREDQQVATSEAQVAALWLPTRSNVTGLLAASGLIFLLALLTVIAPMGGGDFLDRLGLLVFGLASGVCSMSALALHRQRTMVSRHMAVDHPGLSAPSKPA